MIEDERLSSKTFDPNQPANRDESNGIKVQEILYVPVITTVIEHWAKLLIRSHGNEFAKSNSLGGCARF